MSVSETTIDMFHDYIMSVFASQYGVCYPGKSDGVGGWIIECVSDPGKWFIRTWKNGAVAIDKATPMGVPRDPQQRCLTRIVNGERIIEMPDPTSLRQLYGNYANGAATGNIPSAVEGGDKSALGTVQASAMGGMNVSVNAYPAGGLYSFTDGIDLTADEPGSSGQFLWDVVYVNAGVIGRVQSSPEIRPDATALLIATAVAVAIPNGAYRLYAVSLAHGQTDIRQSRFINIQDDFVPTGILVPDSSGNLNLHDHQLQNANIYSETEVTTASSGSALTLDLSIANVRKVTLTANCTFTFSNPPATGKAGTLSLILVQDGTGSRIATWPASVKWSGGTPPTLSTAIGAIDILTFITIDAGATFFGFLSGLAFA